MSGYGEETRASAVKIPVRYRTRNGVQSAPEDLSAYTYSSQKETTLSYRSSVRGKPIPDYVADPYAHFLKNGAKLEIVRHKKEQSIPSISASAALLGNNTPDKIHPPHIDNGHAFQNKKQTCWTSAQKTDYRYRYLRLSGGFSGPTIIYYYGGPIYAMQATIGFNPLQPQLFNFAPINPAQFSIIPNDDDSNLKYWGQKAIGILAPNRPAISLAAILGELREGLPSLIGISAYEARTKRIKSGKSRTIRSAGDEYLNFQFGIVPLMKDIRSTYDALMSVTTRLLQYNRDAGSGIRRRMSFPVTDESTTFGPSALINQGRLGMSTALNPSRTTIGGDSDWGTDVVSSFVTQNLSEKIWFSGSFTYYIPLGKDLSSNWEKYVELGNRLFGTSNSIEVLWQLSPWSWLIDWFLDIQGTISAYERIQDENLVVNYGYVMATSVKKATQLSTIASPLDSRLTAVSTTVTSISKKRVRANPYGFSAAKESDLNPMQWSILAALGFAKLL